MVKKKDEADIVSRMLFYMLLAGVVVWTAVVFVFVY